MRKLFQFGFDFGLFIFWRTVPEKKFAERVHQLMTDINQRNTISPAEVVPFFSEKFVLRDGRRLYRAIPK